MLHPVPSNKKYPLHTQNLGKDVFTPSRFLKPKYIQKYLCNKNTITYIFAWLVFVTDIMRALIGYL